MKTGIFVQVRLGSTRLPSKAVLPIEGLCLIRHVMRALNGVPADVRALLTDRASSERLGVEAAAEGFEVFVGPDLDVLERYCMACRHYSVSRVIRATGDNPLVSANLAREIIKIHDDNQADLSHFLECPIGTGVEVVEAEALFAAEAQATGKDEREHVTLFLYRRRSNFKVLEPHAPPEARAAEARVTVDTADELERVRRIFSDLYDENPIEADAIVRWFRAKAGGKTFLLAPAVARGQGMGHLSRCLDLAGELGRDATVFVEDFDSRTGGIVEERLRGVPAAPQLRRELRGTDRWDIVLLDRRMTSLRECSRFERFGPVFCIDEGGEARDRAAYLINTLPSLPRRRRANVSSLGFLNLPRRKRREVKAPFGRILVSFGGEDPTDLSGKFLHAVTKSRLLPVSSLTVVEGPLFMRRIWPEGIAVKRGISRLTDILEEHDLLVTHFGMGALEAMALGVPVVLLNPTSYHRALGSLLEIPQIGVGRPDLRSFSAILANPRALTAALDRFETELFAQRGMSLASYLRSIDVGVGGRCPACGGQGGAAVGRFPERTYHRCPDCRIIYLRSFRPDEKSYGKEYFFEEYKRQYGKTYLEDFASIKESGGERIVRIRKLLGGKSGTILDVGCAYGPFLAALKDAGYQPFGVDLSAEAVEYVRRELEIPAVQASFETLQKDVVMPGPIRGITLWYVIEHFKDLNACLRKASSLLEPGGVLAFSTPNGLGISARKSLECFLEKSPADHFTVLSPRGLSRMLSRYDLELREVRVTGHHPERFPGPLGVASEKNGPARRLLETASRAFGLGDTFEAYAVKRGRAR